MPLLLLVLPALSACESALLQEPRVPTAATPVPVAQTTSSDPADGLRDFVTAWNSQDFEAMYALLAGRSRELYPQSSFIDKYTMAHSEIRFGGVQHTPLSVEFQGRTAILNYDLTIESPTFGSIFDGNRVMRMVDEGGWKIAWSPMDIIKGMSSRARLNERTEFPDRANIYATDGRPMAQQDAPVYSLYVIKQDISNIDACLNTLALVTRQQLNTLRRIFIDYLDETLFHIAEIDSGQYEIHREALATDCAIRPVDGPLNKVRIYRSRSYYGHGIATHVVGYIGAVPADELDRWEARGYSGGDLVGRAGIELSYEETLAGKPQRYLRIVEGGSTVIRELAGAVGQAPSPVTLTIDRDLQAAMAQALSDAVNYALLNWGGITTGGALVAMNANSGEILALASYPSFDPRIFSRDTEYNVLGAITRLNADPRTPFINKALAEQYTPGSVYKIVTALAAASEKIWSRDEIFNCDYYWYGGRYGDSEPVRTDWRLLETPPKDPAGSVTMAEALAASCNPFFYEMGARMYQARPDMQTEYAQLLGFGRQTGIRGLGIEASGDVAPPGEIAAAINNAIGQGNVAVTIIQMAQLTAAVANGGTIWQPYVVRHIGTEGEPDFKIENEPSVLADLGLDAEALDIVREGMCKVTTVEDLGTAWFVFDDAPYTICGKTGTAETAGNPHAWFVAYWPRDNPAIAFAGVMAHSREGSEVVAPMIRRTLDDYLGEARKDFPEWWQDPYIPVKTQQQALAELAAAEN
ncbi:MAG: penicillin-binding transpeptidase domain-containing protein [Chloroflexi bacterium]|nr:penicillin-binding transpeptidase domain-containing protein [Chloroflexota bacterium]